MHRQAPAPPPVQRDYSTQNIQQNIPEISKMRKCVPIPVPVQDTQVQNKLTQNAPPVPPPVICNISSR